MRDQRPSPSLPLVLGVCVRVRNVWVYAAVAFRLYDLDRDDKISRDELLQVSDDQLIPV